jgi:UDP-glucose 4-epimerase
MIGFSYRPKRAAEWMLIWKGSHLAQAVLRATFGGLLIHSVSHHVDLDTIDLTPYSVVINMAYDQKYMREPYVEGLDYDLAVARRVARSNAHFVMMSTRRVYGAYSPYRISEDHAPNPQDHYGRNKFRTECAVQELLGSQCTILRVANVFDFEPGRHTFFGIALNSLKSNGQITLDVSPFTRRDFIYVTDFANVVHRVLASPPPGLFNLGSGNATAVGHIALWIIEGYQQGSLLVTSPMDRDSFELDTTKLESHLGQLVPNMNIRTCCIEIGEKLKNA